MKVYDCFMYYDEDMVVDIRLNCLDAYVDKFVIVESKFTHSGKKRDLLFDINKFKQFKDKINYIVIDKSPPDLITLDMINVLGGKKKFPIFTGMTRI